MPHLPTTQLGSNGQVVIPGEVRKKLQLRPGSRFVVDGDNGTVVLKEITYPSMDEIDILFIEAKKQARKVGLKSSAITRAIKKVRAAR